MVVCWKLNFSNIIFKGDCLSIVQVVNVAKSYADELNPILHDIWFMLSQAQGWSMSFIPRDVNRVAHTFAKLALSIVCDKY